MRGLEKTLFVVGTTCLAAALSGLGATCGILIMLGGWPSRGGSDMLPGELIYLVFILGMGVVGGIIGFIVATVWICRSGCQPWGRRVWIGATLCLVVGLILQGISWLATLRYESRTSLSAVSLWLNDVAGDLAFDVVRAIPRGISMAENVWGFWPIAVVITPALGMTGGLLARLTRGSARPPINDPALKGKPVDDELS